MTPSFHRPPGILVQPVAAEPKAHTPRVLAITKRCSKCGITKEVAEFYRNPGTKDRRGSWCKACESQRSRRGYRYPTWKKATTARRATKEYRDYNREYLRKKRLEEPEKIRAREIVNTAVRRGKMIRPSTCQRCAATCVPHAHHDDYTKPLQVRWLCAMCHEIEHHGEKP